jgi:hypothetical protein
MCGKVESFVEQTGASLNLGGKGGVMNGGVREYMCLTESARNAVPKSKKAASSFFFIYLSLITSMTW